MGVRYYTLRVSTIWGPHDRVHEGLCLGHLELWGAWTCTTPWLLAALLSPGPRGCRGAQMQGYLDAGSVASWDSDGGVGE